jgi:site-specific DNA-methyltransferase (adenine-specific)
MIENDSFSLYKGDCLEIMKSIPSDSIDMVLTDPPYGTTACKWDSIIDLNKMWNELKRIIKIDSAICLFGSEPFSSNLRMSNSGMFKYDFIWHKNSAGNFASIKFQPLKKHEIISIFYNKSGKYYPQFSKGKPYKIARQARLITSHNDGTMPLNSSIVKFKPGSNNSGYRYPGSILNYPKVSKASLHPTQKPIPLLSYLIKTYSLENETVLDFTMGSGSTGVACLNNNRKFIGIEKDDYYFEVSKKRIVRFKLRLEKSKKDE